MSFTFDESQDKVIGLWPWEIWFHHLCFMAIIIIKWNLSSLHAYILLEATLLVQFIKWNLSSTHAYIMLEATLPAQFIKLNLSSTHAYIMLEATFAVQSKYL